LQSAVDSLGALGYHRKSDVAPQASRAAQPASQHAVDASIAPRHSSFTPSSQLPFGASTRLEPQEPGFYVVPKSVSREALEATLFPAPDPQVMRKFRALNPHRDVVKAGSMIVLSDPNNLQCTREEAQVMAAAETVNAALEDLTAEQADFMHRYAAEIASFTGQTSTWLGVSAVVMEKHLTSLRDTLQAMERLHQDSYRQHGHLKSTQFFTERKLLLAQLDAHLLNSTRLRGHTTLGDHPKLKNALGISNRSLVHHWNKAGAPGQIPGYATHVESTSRAARYMQMGGYVGIGIGGVSSVLAVQAVCNGGGQRRLVSGSGYRERKILLVHCGWCGGRKDRQSCRRFDVPGSWRLDRRRRRYLCRSIGRYGWMDGGNLRR
jgi:hypothetical protein